MNRERAKELVPVIQAYSDGTEYRIKPKPFEGWVNIYLGDTEEYGRRIHSTKEEALFSRIETCVRTVKVREVEK